MSTGSPETKEPSHESPLYDSGDSDAPLEAREAPPAHTNSHHHQQQHQQESEELPPEPKESGEGTENIKQSADENGHARSEAPASSNGDAEAHVVSVPGDNASAPEPQPHDGATADTTAPEVHAAPHVSREEEEQAARLAAYDMYEDSHALGTVAGLVAKTRDVIVPKKVQTLTHTAASTAKNAVTSMVSMTSSVVGTVGNAVASAIPAPVSGAVTQVTGAVSDAAHFAGDKVTLLAANAGSLIERAPDLVIGSIPSSIMSDATKKLVFLDFNNTMRSFFHTNILTLPYVFSEAGVGMGIVLTAFIAFLSEYATEIFFHVKYVLKEPGKVVVYGDVPRMLWGDWYPMFNIVTGWLHMIAFQVFAAKNMSIMLWDMGITNDTLFIGLIVPAIITMPLVFIKNAKHQRPLSIISNTFVTIACIAMMFIFEFKGKDVIYFSHSPDRLSVALGVSLSAYTGIGTAVPVERVVGLSQYTRLLRVAVLTTFLLLTGFGLSGYISYGSNTCSVITLSLPPGGNRSFVSIMLFIATLAILPQQMYAYVEVVDRRLLKFKTIPAYNDSKANWARVACVMSSLFIAYCLPFYGLICSIVGATGCAVLGLIIPAALDYTRHGGRRKGFTNLAFARFLLMAGFGVLALTVGVGASFYDMYLKLVVHPTNSTAHC